MEGQEGKAEEKIDFFNLEQVSLKDWSYEDKKLLLNELGFDTDGEYVTKDNELVLDKYVDVPVKLDNMLIFPGSTIILDDNELSVTMYFQEYCKDE